MPASARPSPRLAVSLAATAALLVSPLSHSSALLDKTRFAAHLGAAYFAFHHWVWAPYQQGRLSSGTTGRTASLAKGGLALLFAAHEVKVAEKIAHDSKSPLLQKLDGDLTNLTSSFGSAGQALRAGKFNPDALRSLNQEAQSVGDAAASAGQPVRDVPVAIPGV